MKVDRYLIEVEGSGRFPLDMLRYDSCWPHSGQDVTQIDSLTSNPRHRRRVKLWCLGEPTRERWESFAWVVKSVEKFR